MVVRLFSIVAILLLSACLPTGMHFPPVTHLKSSTLTNDTIWSGSIIIDGTVKVTKGVTLTIRPGTDIAFVRRDANRDGLGDAVLVVEGELKAVGTSARPILFHSAEADPQPGDWLELRVDFSRNVELRYCEIRDSAYTLHAHFTRGIVTDCTIHFNIDGSRLGQASFVLRNNLIENNLGKGVNFRNSTVTLERNIIRYNGTGIFLFETDRAYTIRDNNLYGNQWNFRLGDFFANDVALSDNWWGDADPQRAAATIFDRRQDPAIGTVTLSPLTAWVTGSGPRDRLTFEPRWTVETGGFIDAPPVIAADTIFAASWDGSLQALDLAGHRRWRIDSGDVIDAPLAVAEKRIYLHNWGREVQCRERDSGALLWSFSYPQSMADDHRQGGVVLTDDLLLVPAWNGTLYALHADSGALLWQYAAGQPLRATPIVAAGRIYLTSATGRLVVLDLEGKEVWAVALAAPLLSSPLLGAAGPLVVDREGTVTAFTVTGERRWSRALGEVCYYAAPVADDHAIYVATAAGGLWKLDSADGTTIWRSTLGGPAYATPLLSGRRLFLALNDGRLLAVNADSGDAITTLLIGAPVQSIPLLHDRQLFFGARDQRLHSVRINESP